MAWIIHLLTCWSLSDQSLAQKERKIDCFFKEQFSYREWGNYQAEVWADTRCCLKGFSCLLQVFTFYFSFLHVSQVHINKLLILPSFVCTPQVLAILMLCVKYYKAKQLSTFSLPWHCRSSRCLDTKILLYTKLLFPIRITVPIKNADFGHEDEMCLL